MSKPSGQGPLLCPAHARQAARFKQVPEGPCNDRVCDVIANPERVEQYLIHIGVLSGTGRTAEATND